MDQRMNVFGETASEAVARLRRSADEEKKDADRLREQLAAVEAQRDALAEALRGYMHMADSFAQAVRQDTGRPYPWEGERIAWDIAQAALSLTPEAALEERRAVEEMVSIVAQLIDDDDCWFDHHGFCQAHGWMRTKPPCPHQRGKEALARLDEIREGK